MTFRQLLEHQPVIAAPGAYDALSARLIEQAGFPLVYFTGLGNEASDLGFPDLGLSEMVRRAGNVCQCVDVPVVCDADTGFGGAVNVRRTVRQFEAAGVAAIHIEDQSFPKRCGFLEGKEVIAAGDFARVLDGALAARRSESFAIIARSDAKAADGVDGVIERLKRYADHGADAVMLGDFYTLPEYERIASSVPVPLIACATDRDHFDRQPDFSLDDWRSAGVRMVIYWHLPLFAAMRAVREVIQGLKDTGSTQSTLNRVDGYTDYAQATDLEEWLRLSDGPPERHQS
jgi:2-methylisocitrate lyase-like PEP mutase family enzyme